MTVANMITLMRFALVPVVIYCLLTDEAGWAFACFLLAGISDGVDGFVARHFNQRTRLGSYLDPSADKLLLVSAFIVLGYMGELPLWLVVVAIFRDAIIVGAVLITTIMGHRVDIRPLLVSKANTAVQIVLVAVVLAELALAISFGPARTILVVVSGLLTVTSGGAYLVDWMRQMGRHGEGEIPRG